MKGTYVFRENVIYKNVQYYLNNTGTKYMGTTSALPHTTVMHLQCPQTAVAQSMTGIQSLHDCLPVPTADSRTRHMVRTDSLRCAFLAVFMVFVLRSGVFDHLCSPDTLLAVHEASQQCLQLSFWHLGQVFVFGMERLIIIHALDQQEQGLQQCTCCILRVHLGVMGWGCVLGVLLGRGHRLHAAVVGCIQNSSNSTGRSRRASVALHTAWA